MSSSPTNTEGTSTTLINPTTGLLVDIFSNASTVELEPNTSSAAGRNAILLDECEHFGNYIASQIAIIEQINPEKANFLRNAIMEDCKKRLAKLEMQEQKEKEKKAKEEEEAKQRANANVQSTSTALPMLLNNWPSTSFQLQTEQIAWIASPTPPPPLGLGGPSTLARWNGPMNAWPKNLMD